MLLKLSLNQRFALTFKVMHSNLKKIQQLLKENNLDSETWVRTPFDNIVEFRVECNLRKAEIIRQLLKNFTVYE